MNKCCWVNGANRLALCRVATNLQFVKKKTKTKTKQQQESTAQFLGRTIKQRTIKQGMSTNIFSCFPLRPSNSLRVGAPLYSHGILSVESDASQGSAYLVKAYPLKKVLWRSCKHLSSFGDYWILNTHGVGICEVISFPKLTRLGTSWHLINSSVLPLNKTILGPKEYNKVPDSSYDCH